jgi:hypothetical protein
MATATVTAPMAGEMSTGDAARAIGVRDWQLTRLFRRGLVSEPARVGRFRIIRAADLPRLREAAVRAGYLTADVAGQPPADE